MPYYEGRRRLLAGEATEIMAALGSAAEASFHQVRDGLPRALTERRA